MIRLNDHAEEQLADARAERTETLAALFKDVPKEDRAAFARVAEELLERLG